MVRSRDAASAPQLLSEEIASWFSADWTGAHVAASTCSSLLAGTNAAGSSHDPRHVAAGSMVSRETRDHATRLRSARPRTTLRRPSLVDRGDDRWPKPQ